MDLNSPNTNCSDFGVLHTRLWYEEIAFYDFNNPGHPKNGSEDKMIGHFTQVIWKETTELGCGVYKGADNFVYGVCNYAPPGNVIGNTQNYYETNVLPLAGNVRRRRRDVNNAEQTVYLNS